MQQRQLLHRPAECIDKFKNRLSGKTLSLFLKYTQIKIRRDCLTYIIPAITPYFSICFFLP